MITDWIGVHSVLLPLLSLVKWLCDTATCVVLQVVELLSMEDVDLTPEQIKDIIDLLEKESKVRKADGEESDKVTDRID